MVNWLNFLDNNNGAATEPKKIVPSRPIIKRVEPVSEASADIAIDQMRMIDGKADAHGNSAQIDQFAKQACFMQRFDTLVEKYTIPTKGFTYNDFSDSELRSYFTWRKDVRDHKITIAPVPFVTIYFEEIANLCGVQSNTEAINTMLSFWKNAHDINSDIDSVCQLIIHDMFISRETKLDYINDIVSKYPANIKDNELLMTDILNSNYCNALDFLIKNSNYELNKSDFYIKNKSKYKSTLTHVLNDLNHYFTNNNVNFNELLCGSKISSKYKVFDKYLIRVEPACKDNSKISDQFTYVYAGNGLYDVTRFISTAFSTMFIGYILRFTEAELRRITHTKALPEIVFTKIFEVSNSNKELMNLIECDNFINCIKRSVQASYLGEKSDVTPETNDTGNIYSRIHSFVMPANTFAREENEPYFDYRAIRFHLQAEKFSQYEDDYNKKEKCNSDITLVYTDLTENQLKYYFTWRKYARRKQYIATEYAYVLLYLAELFNLIDETNPENALSTIIEFWKEYRKLDRTIDNDIPNWIKDFYLHYNIKGEYSELLKRLSPLPVDESTCITEIYHHNYSNKTYFIDNHSSYHFVNSPFSRNLLFTFDEILPSVFSAVDKYFEMNGFDFTEILIGETETNSCWKPFKNSAVEIKKIGSDRTVTIGAFDKYQYTDGVWQRSFKNLSNNASVIIGYIVRTTESRLRHHTNFKTPLKSDLSSLTKIVKNHPSYEKVLISENLESVIINTVNDYLSSHKQLKDYFNKSIDARPDAEEIKPVTVDLSKLSAIRDAANDIQEKLVIEDEEYTTIAESSMAKENKVIEQVTNNDTADTNNDNPLNNIQKKCLVAVLSQDNVHNKLVEIANTKGMLPEAILDSINEALYDIFSDNIIVTDCDEPYIYEDYIEEARNYGE